MTGAEPTQRSNATLRSLRVRNYRLFFFGQMVSQSGTWMQTVALGWLVLEIGHNSGFAVGAVLALQLLPTLLLGVFTGVITDRFNKRVLLIISQTALAITAAALATLTLTGIVEMWMVYALALLAGLAQTIDMPTRQSFVAEMVTSDDLPNAIALNAALVQVARIVGPALAALVIVAVGTGTCFLLNAISFLAVIFGLAAMRDEELYRAPQAPRARGQVREGLRYVWRTPRIRAGMIVVLMAGVVASNNQVVLPLLAKITFHGTAASYSLMTVALGAGAIGGALVAANQLRPSGRVLIGAMFVLGIVVGAATLAPSLATFALLMIPAGAFQTTVFATANSMLQLETEAALRGRVMAIWSVMIASPVVAVPLIGLLSQALGPWVGLASGACAAAVAVALAGPTLFRRQRRTGYGGSTR